MISLFSLLEIESASSVFPCLATTHFQEAADQAKSVPARVHGVSG